MAAMPPMKVPQMPRMWRCALTGKGGILCDPLLHDFTAIGAMSRRNNRQAISMRARIAAAAARIMAEDGVDDFALAKRKAARSLGASETEALPANDEIEAELRAYRDLYQPEEHAQRIVELRSVA